MLQNKFSLFDRSKILFTVIIGLMFFFYDVGTIQDLTIPMNMNTLEPIHPAQSNPGNHILPTKNYSLQDLLTGFDRTQGSGYQQAYQSICEYDPGTCSAIQLQFTQPYGQEYYYGLLTVFTLQELNKLLLTQDTLHTTIILKNEPNPKKRGYATKQSIVINTYNLSKQEFFEVLVHELGHTLDLAVIVGDDKQLNSDYTEFQKATFSIDDPSLEYYALSRKSEGTKQQGSKKEDFCTLYGSSNPFEDFSECFNLYINHHDYFVSLTQHNTLLQKKYNLIATWVRYSPLGAHFFSDYNQDITYRYRDSTKIAIEKQLEITES